MQHLLDFLIAFPIIGGILVILTGSKLGSLKTRVLAMGITVLALIASVILLLEFDTQNPALQFVEDLPWLPWLGINYGVGVDGLSVVLIALTAFTTLIVVLVSWSSIHENISGYLGAFLVMQGLLVGVFSATDAILFYIFWEATLIPMYLIIGIWGHEAKVYAALKFFLYTFLGSVLMLAAFLYLGFQVGSFHIATMYLAKLSLPVQQAVFIAFFMGFAVKIPMFPVHTWLPDAHTEAPAGGSILLAAILLKLGAYGFIRFALPIIPDACRYFSWDMMVLSLIAVVYIGLVAIVQTDMKRLIAYSSISHMGFVTLASFLFFFLPGHDDRAYAALGLEGAIFIMISHAFVASAMFAGVGFIQDRLHTRQIKDLGGIVQSMPIFASFYMLFAMANAGLPGTTGFVGEFMVILAVMKANFFFAFFAATTLIIGASYTLWMYKRVIFGPIENPAVAKILDLNGYELTAYVILAVMVIALGVYPNPVLKYLHQSVDLTLNLAGQSKL